MRSLTGVRHNRVRRDVSAFADNIGSVSRAAFPLPANIELFVRSAGATGANAPALLVNGKTIQAPPLRAGQVRSVGWHERGSVVQVQGTFELLIDKGLGKYVPVGAEVIP